MKVTTTDLPDVLVFEPKSVRRRTRVCFLESFSQRAFDAAGWSGPPVRPGQPLALGQGACYAGCISSCRRNAQGKLVRGDQRRRWFDVAVDHAEQQPDVRGAGRAWELSASNHRQLCGFRPGFAHGFLVLSETADFPLQDDRVLRAASRKARLRWDDPNDWHRVARCGDGAPALGQGISRRRCFAAAQSFD